MGIKTKQVPDIIYKYLPDFKLPGGFFDSTTGNPNCLYFASCTENLFLYVSESFAEIVGYDAPKILNGGLDWWFSLVHPDDIQQMLSEIFQHCFLRPVSKRLNKPFLLEFRFKKSDGSWIWLREIKCVVSLTGTGFNEMILGRFEDITEIKKAEENQFRQLMKEQGNTNPLLKAALPVVLSKLEGNVKHLPVSKQTVQPKGTIMPTRREKEILYLIGEGYSTKQIAEKLFISINTVETHRRHLLAKIQVKNSMELIKQTTNAIWLKAM